MDKKISQKKLLRARRCFSLYRHFHLFVPHALLPGPNSNNNNNNKLQPKAQSKQSTTMRVMGALAASLLAMACTATSVSHESIRAPEGWRRGSQVASRQELQFTFALKHTEPAKAWLADTVAAVSNPDSARYGEHVSLPELINKMRVPAAHAAAVRRALEEAGFRNVELKRSGDFLVAEAGAEAAAAFFGTDFCEWTSTQAAATRIIRACGEGYSLPAAVSPLVDFVGGLVHFPLLPKDQAEFATAPLRASGDVAQLRKSYNVEGVKASGATNASVAFTQFVGQEYSPSDLTAFIGAYSPAQNGQKIAKKIGHPVPGSGIEANLDSQYLLAMSNGVPTWVWDNQHKNKVNNQEPWVEFFTNVSSDATVPSLVSISYGEGENTLTKTYIDRADVELQKAAARGLTLLASSGDNGSGCKDNRFVANFPTSLPHITSVGGTQDCTPSTGAAGFSSGGFSNSFPRPAWQAAAVAEFLKSANLPPQSYWNRTGRAYPDVAACGDVTIYAGGSPMPVGGTSCSCPIFSGVVGLLLDARLKAGKSPFGFLAPALYKAYANDKAAFNDVTTGSTQGCNQHSWSATAGWDATTGLGTPNYVKLLAQLNSF